MARRIVFLVAITGSLALMAVGCGTSELQRHKEGLARSNRLAIFGSSGLALSLQPRKDVFRMNEPVVIDYRLTNVSLATNTPSPADINVYSEFQQEGFLLSFELYRIEGNEKTKVHASPAKTVNPDDDLPKYSHYVKLQPGFFHGRPIQIDAGRLKAGIYEMTARYDNEQKECLLSRKMTADKINLIGMDDAFVPLWKGSLKSNTVVFEVQK